MSTRGRETPEHTPLTQGPPSTGPALSLVCLLYPAGWAGRALQHWPAGGSALRPPSASGSAALRPAWMEEEIKEDDLPSSPRTPSHQSRPRPGNGLKTPRGCCGPLATLPPLCPQGDPLGGPGHGFRVWGWDAEAGGGGMLGLPAGALHNPGIRVRVVLQCVPLTLQQLHLGGR